MGGGAVRVPGPVIDRFALATAAMVALLPAPAAAQCSPNNIGQTLLNTSGTASAPVADTFWNPNNQSYSYSAQGLNLYVVDNGNLAQKWIAQASPSTIQNFPIPVPLRNNP